MDDNISTDVRRSPVVALDGNCELGRAALGNKAYGINLMRGLRLPVPPAFCLTTDVCAQFLAGESQALDQVWPEALAKLRWLERETSRTYGRGPRPLLVSVRSGAAQSMPGMLDTVLDLGIDDTVHHALAHEATPKFADDTRARFHDMYQRIVLAGTGSVVVPDDPYAQLRAAIEAVFRSWNSPRAVTYRDHHRLGDSGGTAVIVQAMVFGNLGRTSGTGVLFTRNPTTGADEPFGEWLAGGQGEDVVSGTFDCAPISALREEQPALFAELMAHAESLERLAGDVQDIEFTVEEGRLWLLQTRIAKRSAQAAVRLALRMRDQGLIDDTEVLRRVGPEQIRMLLKPALQPEIRLAATLLAKGLPASPGVVSGKAYSDVDAAIDAADDGEDVILVRPFTSPDDVQAMLSARGVVTEVGGATSHAAVVSREIGRPAVVGCGAGVAAAIEGKSITVDGAEGEVREGVLPLVVWSEEDSPDLRELADIARRVSPLRAHHAGDYPVLPNDSDVAVRDALTAGHTDVVSASPLITMLTAQRMAKTAPKAFTS
ncbi:pyruvate, phosphate dikinase [Mycolicibacter algericus]|uniref:Pyruvate, phosphate dikinase n=1 Tax=Mycolicibacter algericus TaxID=1288388 RepID=A0A7I9Y647_MYCAL|nr:pyruvate, phosphate dikinase [Mycolicibacter algericus]GFG83963.1 pyruvate, phosphate dikinase [Mycolicibacter algericus]